MPYLTLITVIALCAPTCAWCKRQNSIASNALAVMAVALFAPIATRAMAIDVFHLPLIEWWIVTPVSALATALMYYRGIDWMTDIITTASRRRVYRSEVRRDVRKYAAREYKVVYGDQTS